MLEKPQMICVRTVRTHDLLKPAGPLRRFFDCKSYAFVVTHRACLLGPVSSEAYCRPNTSQREVHTGLLIDHCAGHRRRESARNSKRLPSSLHLAAVRSPNINYLTFSSPRNWNTTHSLWITSHQNTCVSPMPPTAGSVEPNGSALLWKQVRNRVWKPVVNNGSLCSQCASY